MSYRTSSVDVFRFVTGVIRNAETKACLYERFLLDYVVRHGVAQ